jgi:signal transduction histidine kinase
MLSLRRRALIAGAVSAALSIIIGGLALSSYIDRKVLERFDRTLQERHTHLVVGLSAANQDPDRLQQLIFDPAYQTPRSGRYWQLSSQNGDTYTSPSLMGTSVPEPQRPGTAITFWNMIGPEGEALRGAFEQITLEDGSIWGVSVAETQAALISEGYETHRSLTLAFMLVGVIGLGGTLLLVSFIHGPLRKLQEDVTQRWKSGDEIKPEDYPEEVAPLVEDINELLHRNRDIVDRSRRQAADLAHSLKTPTSILRNELEALSSTGAEVSDAQDALERVDAQLSRSLARMRAANSAQTTHARTNLSNSIARLSRLFSIIAEREGKSLETQSANGISIRMDTQDIEEVIGNLVDNAIKWAEENIRLTASQTEEFIKISIEDDGPGIPDEAKRDALRSGGRLDTSKPGTGLGLAIAVDLLQAYGASLTLNQSEALGGLAVRVLIPRSMT